MIGASFKTPDRPDTTMSAIMPTYARYDLSFERGEGVWLIDKSGDRYLDFGAGIAVNSLGHAHPYLVEALKTQAEKLWHTSNLYHIEGQQKLAEKLVAHSFADKVFFCNSGAEAVECAVKMVRKYHHEKGDSHKNTILTFEGAFHGRTIATLSAAGNPKHLDGFQPSLAGFSHIKLGDLEAVKSAITETTAGILIEPIQGEGGVREVSSAFLKFLRDICDEHDLLLIFDEVQTGIGRTGHLFAHELAGITPDVMALAKGLGGGFPIGACLATQEACSGMLAGTHGSTFGGNPLACAVAIAVLDVVLEEGFLENVRHKGLLLKQKLAGLCDSYPDIFIDVRGEGLLLGLQCKLQNTEVIAALTEEKCLCVPASDNIIRLIPPLIVSEEELEENLDELTSSYETIHQKKAGAS